MEDAAFREAWPHRGRDHQRGERRRDQGHVHHGREPGDVGPRSRSRPGGLAKLEHMVVQDIFLTETAMIADVVLPSSAWPEKSGTVTNTNRQVQMGRKALRCQATRAKIFGSSVELAKRLGLHWTYSHPSEVFAEMKLAMPSLDNITWERLERESSMIYPCPAAGSSRRGDCFRRRLSDPDRARAVWCRPMCCRRPRCPDDEYPVGADNRAAARALAYGGHDPPRRRARRARAGTDREPAPGDAGTLRRWPGQNMRVTTRSGTHRARRSRRPRHPGGSIFIPFAYVEAAANILTNPQLDPIGKIPEYKYCAVKIEAAHEHERASTVPSLNVTASGL